MNPALAHEQRVEWLAPVIVTAVALAAVFVLLWSRPNFSQMAGLFLVVPLGCLGLAWLFVHGQRGTRVFCLVTVCIYLLVSWQMLSHSDALRAQARWTTDSRSWKAEALNQPPIAGSEMKCLLWDGWGMTGQNTVVYLVFDPDDGLRHYSISNLSGMPFRAGHVQRLAQQWYSVTLFDNRVWDGCGVSRQ